MRKISASGKFAMDFDIDSRCRPRARISSNNVSIGFIGRGDRGAITGVVGNVGNAGSIGGNGESGGGGGGNNGGGGGGGGGWPPIFAMCILCCRLIS